MLENIIEKIQLQGTPHLSKKAKMIKSVNAGALGFSFGLTFSDDIQKNYGFQTKLTLLSKELEKHGKGILFLVDEVRAASEEMRELATGYQELVGDGANVAIAMAGLPTAISTVLSDDILTFLNRAFKVHLGPLPLGDISIYFSRTFSELGIDVNAQQIEKAVAATQGYPYLLQLIGYYLVELARDEKRISPETLELALSNSKRDMVENTFAPVLKPLSQKDRDFLKAMSVDNEASRVSDIRVRMNTSASMVQAYKTRLIESEVVSSPGRGLVEFQLPYFGEYLRGEF